MFKKIKSILKNIFHIKRYIAYYQYKYILQSQAATNNKAIINEKLFLDKPVIVSLTTYSNRIHDVHLTIESIAMQTQKANRVILWLDEKEFSLDNLPLTLKLQSQRGLEIKFCNNYKSYKKLIPTLEYGINCNHNITIDDDILYPPDLIDRFSVEYRKGNKNIQCNRAYIIKKRHEKVSPYHKWKLIGNNKENVSGFDIFPTGVGGVFYPNDSFNEEVVNILTFSSLAPYADDIWFKCMTLLNNKSVTLLNRTLDFEDEFFYIEGSQSSGLFHENVYSKKNDVQLESVLNKYPEVIKKIVKCNDK